MIEGALRIDLGLVRTRVFCFSKSDEKLWCFETKSLGQISIFFNETGFVRGYAQYKVGLKTKGQLKNL